MVQSQDDNARRMELPRINVDATVGRIAVDSVNVPLTCIQSSDETAISSFPATPTTPINAEITPASLLATPTFTARDRSLSGSTAHSDSPLLKPPQPGDASSSRRPSTAFTEADREEALRPDPGQEKDFIVRGENKFAFSPGQLNKLLNPKSLAAYAAPVRYWER